MAWVFLLIAAACEMIWPLGYKYTEGFSKNYWAIIVTFGVMGLSLWLMSLAVKRGVPIGTAYAVWTGLGAAGTVTLGIFLFNESRDWLRIVCIGFVILGAVGLKFLSPPEDAKPATTPTSQPTE